MQDVITNNYLVCHHRKGYVYKVTASDYESARVSAQDLHHMNASSMPETFLYCRSNGDWDLLEYLSYEIRNGRFRTVRKK